MGPILASPFIQGQVIVIRSSEEIAATLDADGKLEGLLFMPEMACYCGSNAIVHRNVDKTCVEGFGGMRRMFSTVLLKDLKCDGSSHGGCQRGCLFFWKAAWLRPAEEENGTAEPQLNSRVGPASTLLDLPTYREDRYYCQSTELFGATHSMSRWNLTNFFRELGRGELKVPGFMQILFLTSFNRFRKLLGFQAIGAIAGIQYGNSRGNLGLQPGEWVEVLSRGEIQATLDPNGKNRGLAFTPAMFEYIGKRYQVETQLQRIILEKSGEMASLMNTVTLKGVTCHGPCANNCPRNNSHYWRECWLRRV